MEEHFVDSGEDRSDLLTPVERKGPQTGDRQNFLRQFPKNLGSNIALFLVNVAVGIWLTPYFIHNLGVAAYGLIPLAMSLTQYVALVTMGVSGGISRFLTIDLQQKNFDRANKTFNTSFWSLLVLIIAFLPLLAVLVFSVPVLFKIPADHVTASKWLFAGVTLAFLISTLSSSFGASTFARNRLDLRNLVQIMRSGLRLVFVVLLFWLLGPSLEWVAATALVVAGVGFAANYLLWRKLTPELTVDISCFDRSRLKELLSMGGWLIVNQIGYLLFLQIDLIVVNRLFGPTAGGEYASILQWSMLLRTMAGVFSGLLAPMYMISYAKGNIQDMIRISKMAVKFMGLGLAVPIGLACGFSPELLSVWIGPEFSRLAPLMILMLIHLTVNLAVLPLFSINICYNRIRIPGLVTLSMGVLNLALAVLIPVVFNAGYYGVALAGAIVLTLKNALFTPWYASRILGIGVGTFISEMGSGIIATLSVFGVSWLLSGMWAIDSWTKLIFSGSLIGLVYATVVWFYALSQGERRLVLGMIERSPHGTA